MSKPTIFFSHSSKDKTSILPIKDKISKITGKTIEIFMSSDGESIPFGRNWVHKVEEGLNNAKIMFVFVTSNSIDSAWIYFEAGFAYSKGIGIIPVGVGVNIGELKPPLSLLQGFNITSADSLNNFTSIINKKFDYAFEELFSEDDYNVLFDTVVMPSNQIKLKDVFKNAEYDISEYRYAKYLHNIDNYLDSNKIPHNHKDPRTYVNGIEFSGNSTNRISFHNFEESFNLLKTILLAVDITGVSMELYFNDNYRCVYEPADMSALLFEKGGIFKYYNRYTVYNDLISFQHFDPNRQYMKFDISKVEAKDITNLINELIECGLIYKIEE